MKNYMKAIENYVNFTGRARREEYWLFWLANFVIQVILMTIDASVGTGQALFMLYSLFIFLPSLAVTVRRLHDSNRSGWWVLIAFIPVVGLIAGIYFMVVDSTPGDNDFGPNPKGITA
ncbi:DUF805 domain-containing protein [Photobacterium sp. 1_MG-2023]|uniref:DUF805 domain-containing protein n=1 Tax=Photobacterium sp. 1_MG-2023 TaxID=3062646 RepID=UPI0026E20D8B|nr:DUF805 domain-containing protein [Photobacterium sp. 1_MG-2023]MDO6705535.1 DUF805 domain-containing protein [Photobacterium sp. 1_MG-2023]